MATARLRTVDQLKKVLPWLQSRGFSLRMGSGDTLGTPQGHQVSPIMASKVSGLGSGDTRDTRLTGLTHAPTHINILVSLVSLVELLSNYMILFIYFGDTKRDTIETPEISENSGVHKIFGFIEGIRGK